MAICWQCGLAQMGCQSGPDGDRWQRFINMLTFMFNPTCNRHISFQMLPLNSYMFFGGCSLHSWESLTKLQYTIAIKKGQWNAPKVWGYRQRRSQHFALLLQMDFLSTMPAKRQATSRSMGMWMWVTEKKQTHKGCLLNPYILNASRKGICFMKYFSGS